MAITWPNSMRSDFGNALLQGRHTLNTSPLFCDASLAALLDAYPREQLGIWTFAEHGEGEDAPVRGCAPDISGKDLLAAVRNGRIWLNLRATNQHVADYASVSDDIFNSITNASGHRTLKRDMGILISSPNVHVHYHLDIPLVALLQVRGEKKVWFYPADAEFAPDERLEAIALREQEEGLAFKSGFDAAATCVDLTPGMAVTWPQTAPHRIQNGDMMNVSLSCEFMTLPAIIRANAIYANGRLRRDLGLRPNRARSLSPSTVGKAALARLLKSSRRAKSPASEVLPSFEVDLTVENCTRPLRKA